MLLVLELTEVDMRKTYRMALMISFVQRLKGGLKGLTDMICDLFFPLSLCRTVEIYMGRNG